MRSISLFILIACSACRPVVLEETARATTSRDETEVSARNADTLLTEQLSLERETGLMLLSGLAFSGAAIDHHETGQVAAYTEYVAGKKHGLHQRWFADGQASFEGYYYSGRRHGPSASWWSNGCPRTQSHFEHGDVHGEQLAWYQNGALFQRLNLVHGQEQGLQQAWRKNGKLYSNYEARDGRIYGLKRASLCYQLENEIIN
ncbi:MAG: toxin-antitoxin system YwqK family antitoxin [Bacteroidota bacterium]